MNKLLRTAAALLTLLAAGSVAQAQRFECDHQYDKVIGFRVDSSYLTDDGGSFVEFGVYGDYLAVGGALFDIERLFQLGPVFRDRTRDARRIAFHSDRHTLLVFALGKELTLWSIPGADIPAPGSVLPFAYADAKPATNPSFEPLLLPDALTKLNARQGLVVSYDEKYVVVVMPSKVEKRSLETGRIVAVAQTGASVRRIYPLGEGGSYLLWSPERYEPMRTWNGISTTVDTFTEPPSPVPGLSRSKLRIPPAISQEHKTALELVNLEDRGGQWVYVWDLVRRKVVKTVPGFKDATAIMYLTVGDGHRYVVGYRTGRIEIRDVDHKVFQVVAPGTVVNDNDRAPNCVAELATPLFGGFRFAAYHARGELVVYKCGSTLVQPNPTVSRFPARIGSRWVYKYIIDGRDDGEMVFEIGGVEIVGTDQCIRMDRSYTRNGRDKGHLESLLMTYRPDGLYWVGTVGRDSSEARLFNPPVLVLPADGTKPDLDFTSKFPLNAVEFKLRLQEATIDVPYRARIAATRLDRNMSKGVNVSEAIWFAKDVGIVKWQDATNHTLLELKNYTSGK